MTENDHTYDLEDDVPQYLGAAFRELAGRPVTVETLVEQYKPPTPNNMGALLATLRRDSGVDKTTTSIQQIDKRAGKSHLITEVLKHALTKDGRSAFSYDEDDKTWSLVDEFGEHVDLDRVGYG